MSTRRIAIHPGSAQKHSEAGPDSTRTTRSRAGCAASEQTRALHQPTPSTQGGEAFDGARGGPLRFSAGGPGSTPGRACSYCHETLPGHIEADVHPDCESPYAAQVAAILADEESERDEVFAEMHWQLDLYCRDLARDAEIDSAHDLDAERLLAGVA